MNVFHGTTMMRRDLYYSHVKLFKSQNSSNRVLSQFSRSLLVGHDNLNVLASPKGLVYGPISWQHNGSEGTISAQQSAKLIPRNAILFPSFKIILVVEKESIFHFMCSTNLVLQEKCLLVTAKGYPDNLSREFLRAASNQGKIPICIMYA
jgi:meiotic recombination protein SPO11